MSPALAGRFFTTNATWEGCNGTLFSLKKEGNSDTRYTIDELRGHCAKWNKSDTKEQICMIPLYEIFKASKFMETQSRMVVTRDCGGGEMGS